MNKINEINEENSQIQEKPFKKSNIIINLILIGAVLIMAVVLVNNMVTARTPIISDEVNESAPISFSPAFSCCARNQAQVSAESIGQEALVYSRAVFGEEADTAAVEDYGCHQEVVLFKDGRPIRRLAFTNGVFSDLGPISDEAGS